MARRYLPLRAGLIGLAYFAVACVTMRFTRFDGGVGFLWIATAILLAELSSLPPTKWPAPIVACMIAAAAATATFGLGPLLGVILAPMLAAEAIVAAVLIRVLPWRIDELSSLRAVAAFVAIAGIIAPGIVGLPVTIAIFLATHMPFWDNWGHWYLGHALGTITFAPILMLAFGHEARGRLFTLTRAMRIEALALGGLHLAVCLVVFGQSRFPLLFLPLLPMMLAAFRLGRVGAAVSVVILSTIGGIMTVRGSGPLHLVSGGPGPQMQFLQFYLAVVVATVLPVAAELKRRKALFLALQESEARYRLITDGSSDVIMNLDCEGRIRYVSPSVAELAGYDAPAILGMDAGTLVMPQDRTLAAATHRKALSAPGATFIVQYRALTASGGAIWCESHTRGFTDEAGRLIGAVSQIRSIAHHKTIEADLAHAARTDALTGLVNRRVFDEMLDLRIDDVHARRGQGCCAILDLDFFKRVNDAHGHDAGDRVLRVFADVAAASMREGDLIARLGGEEFGLILWGADLAEAHRVCERLRLEIADLSVATEAGEKIGFTFSGGLARIADGLTRDEILREADEALYHAKHAGRNRLALAA